MITIYGKNEFCCVSNIVAQLIQFSHQLSAIILISDDNFQDSLRGPSQDSPPPYFKFCSAGLANPEAEFLLTTYVCTIKSRRIECECFRGYERSQHVSKDS